MHSGILRALALAAAVLAGCSTQQVIVPHQVPLIRPDVPPVESELLDVGVVVFDPGVPKGELSKVVLEDLIDEGVYAHIRRLESVLLASHLRETLQNTGHWGSVWVVPSASMATDVTVTARILESDGYVARVAVDVSDAAGRHWIDKTYEVETAAAAYNRQRYPNADPYQDLFNSIANDMARARAALPGTAEALRTIGGLRYAAALSKEAFGGYVGQTAAGLFEPVRLPARDDPMFVRTEQVRVRERLFLETLGQHYDRLGFTAQPSYDGWRQLAREESLSVRDLKRATRWRTVLGFVSLAGGLASGGTSSAFVQNSLLFVADDLLKMRAQGLRDQSLHARTLSELSGAFDDELEPTVLELEGVEHRLVGAAEVRYAEWMDLLRRMFVAETESAAADPLVP